MKIFANTDFGYHRITVERPLKLNFQASDDRIEILKATKGFARWPEGQQQDILAALATLDSDRLYKNRDDFLFALTATGAPLTAAQRKLVVESLSERDETADVITNRKGRTRTRYRITRL